MLNEILKNKLFSVSLKLLFAFQVQRSLVSASINTMRVVKQNQFGGVKELYIDSNQPKPEPSEKQVLIKVAATALNRADLLMREGKYPNMKGPLTLGLEVSGIVEQLGSNCNKWKLGDKVMGLLPGGGYAEYAAVDEDHIMNIPDGVSLVQAAAIPEVWLTAYQLLHFVGDVKKGDKVLIHGGGSGVGTAAVQLVKLSEAHAIVTAGTDEKIAMAQSLGAATGFNYKEGEFADKVLEHTDGKGVNLILDCVGGSYWKQNIKSISFDGTWVVYGLLGGGAVDGPLLSQILGKRVSMRGTTLKARSDEYKKSLVEQFTKNALPYFSSGASNKKQLAPVIDRIMNFNEVADAHSYMATNKNKGKIILQLEDNLMKNEL